MNFRRFSRSAGGFIDQESNTGAIRTIAMLGNHVPRQCGIATFTSDLGNRRFLDLVLTVHGKQVVWVNRLDVQAA